MQLRLGHDSTRTREETNQLLVLACGPSKSQDYVANGFATALLWQLGTVEFPEQIDPKTQVVMLSVGSDVTAHHRGKVAQSIGLFVHPDAFDRLPFLKNWVRGVLAAQGWLLGLAESDELLRWLKGWSTKFWAPWMSLGPTDDPWSGA